MIHKITSEIGTFVPGMSYPVATVSDEKIGVFICYEAIIPQLARHLVTNGANVLVNISNDAWYSDSAAAYQHLEMARLRAIENHRYLLRATDNGVTTVIDPYGRVLSNVSALQRLAFRRILNSSRKKHFTPRTEILCLGLRDHWSSLTCRSIWAVEKIGCTQ